MTFEEWWDGQNQILANKELARVVWNAGAEAMRADFAAKIEQNWGKGQADLCRKFQLPVGESSRAPEGSTK